MIKYLLRIAFARTQNLFSMFNEACKPCTHRTGLPGEKDICTGRGLWDTLPVNRILLCITCAVFISITYSRQEIGTSKTLVTIDDVKISTGEFNERFTKELKVSADRSSLTQEDYEHLKEEFLNALINEKVMLLRVRELSLSVGDAELMKKVEEIKESHFDGFVERVIA